MDLLCRRSYIYDSRCNDCCFLTYPENSEESSSRRYTSEIRITSTKGSLTGRTLLAVAAWVIESMSSLIRYIIVSGRMLLRTERMILIIVQAGALFQTTPSDSPNNSLFFIL
jgi:hypothetical protein